MALKLLNYDNTSMFSEEYIEVWHVKSSMSDTKYWNSNQDSTCSMINIRIIHNDMDIGVLIWIDAPKTSLWIIWDGEKEKVGRLQKGKTILLKEEGIHNLSIKW